jgi:hypothetical protein
MTATTDASTAVTRDHSRGCTRSDCGEIDVFAILPVTLRVSR